MEKEEYALVLDYLPYGYPLEKTMFAVVQAIGEKNLTLLQIVPRKGTNFELKERIYIGDGKRDKVLFIKGRLPREKLTETAKAQLDEFIEKAVERDEKKFVDFFNNAQPINTRLHQLELLPGFGKKHMQAILTAREEKPFENFEDIKNRVPNLPNPKKAIEKRLATELTEMERNNLFIQ
jgi:putative nucleotide binding protein